MSRLGRKPILIPAGVEVKIEPGRVSVRGPKGELSRLFKDDIAIEVNDGALLLSIKKPSRLARALWGTYASHLKNMMAGVTQGFSKRLELQGIGYKAELKDKELVLSLGFSHPVRFKAPEGIDFKVEKNVITVAGTDKERVGLISAQLRMLKKPEPYKGKGIRYEGEVVRRKAGKRAAGTAA